MTSTRTDGDGTRRSTLLTELAIRSLLRPAGAIAPTCGLCANPLTRLNMSIEHHEVTVLVCSACSWHTRFIDGHLATANDLLAITRNPALSTTDHPRRAADAVTWYRATHEYRER